MSQKLKELVASIVADGKLSLVEANKLRVVLYEDGSISIDELNTLFEIKEAVKDGDNDPAWPLLFVKACTDAVLGDPKSPNAVDSVEADILMQLIGKEVDALELALLVSICSKASSCDETLALFTLNAIKEAILADLKVDAPEVDMLSKVIYGTGGTGGASVSKEELAVLCAINDATKGADNDPSWAAFFVKAGTDAFLQDGVLDADEANELVNLIGADGEVSPNEKALVANIMEVATSVDPAFQEYAATL